MTTQAVFRDVQYIPHARHWSNFQDMCLHVYEEVYYSSRLYGRHGQAQYGLDILLNDYRAAPVNKHKGMVFVQCKFTEKAELGFSAVKHDVLEARKKVATCEDYAGVYLYIVATNAKNDVDLHDRLQALRVEENLPFEIELHTWDKLCSIIQKSDRLWELYNDDPGSGVEAGMRAAVHQVTHAISSLVRSGRLEDAQVRDQQRRGQRSRPGYGSYATPPAENVWKHSPELRKTLLDLYAQAADSSSAFELLQHEFSLGNLQDVDSCLAYLRAARIVENLRSPGVMFRTVIDQPCFTQTLEALAGKIVEMQGSPEKMACVAVILIMESDNHDTQDVALQMMTRLRDRDVGTAWEYATVIAHAIVRYYYVVRRGWAPLARTYVVGDILGRRDWTGVDSERLNRPFAHDEHVSVTMAGTDPLATPRYGWGSMIIRNLSRYLADDHDHYALPELLTECRVYSSQDYDDVMPHWREYKTQLTDQRVVDFATLARAAAQNVHIQLLEHYTPVITERSFERLLGYRAYLRAYVERVGEPADKYAKTLEATESLISTCRYLENDRDIAKGSVWVVPVYDNLPRRLDDWVPEHGFQRGPFTLANERLVYWRQRVEELHWASKWREELDKRYLDRSDEFSLSCLLALHRHQAMLTYSYEQSSQAAQMGIAADYPHRLHHYSL